MSLSNITNAKQTAELNITASIEQHKSKLKKLFQEMAKLSEEETKQ
jgi:hypothetical protein